MKWIKKAHPKKGKFTGIRGSKIAVLKWSNGQHCIAHWLGDRWNDVHESGNKIIAYMWLTDLK